MNLSIARIVFQLGVGLSVLLTASHGFACGAVGGDNGQTVDACDEAGASVHPAAGPASATAHPVDLLTGNKYLRQTDARWPGGLSLVRHYNSRHTGKGVLGPGWRHAFEARLFFRQRGQHLTVQIIQGDGRRIVFRGSIPASSAPRVLQAMPSLYGTVRHQPDLSADRRWLWRWRDGSALFFSAQGLLTSVERANGYRLRLTYGGNDYRLLQVTNRHRQSLQFQYDQASGRLREVVLPDQQVIHYQYDSTGVLISVARADQKQWTFEHADHLLGAITVVRNALGNVMAQVRYGPQGRAVYSSLARHVDAIAFRYQLPSKSFGIGHTQVWPAASPQQVSRWQWRYDPVTQERQLLSASGPGCAACPPTGVSNLYDAQRRLTEQRNTDGTGLAYHYDRLNRLSGIGWLTRRRHPKSPDIQLHYESEALDAPVSRIDRRSIKPDGSHRVQFERDALGRIIRMIESGFEPDLSTLTRLRDRSSKGQSTIWQVGRWRPLQRQWTFQYVPFGAAAGLPWQIDGPLPGPKDAIRFVYDQAGRPTHRFGPHRRQVGWQYNAKGLLAQTLGDGIIVESRRYDAFNRVVGRETHGVKTRFAYDAAGHRIETAASNQPTIRFVRDGNGRLIGLHDDQSRELTIASVIMGLQSHLTAAIATRPGGGQAIRPSLQLINHAFGLYEKRKPATAETEFTIVDDFGRLLARADSETGLERFVYDAADRPVARVDDAGTVSRFHYHDNGRLQKISRPAGDLFDRRWHNGFLRSESQAYQRIKFQHDAVGRQTARSVRYQDPVTRLAFLQPMQQAWAYDGRGRLSKFTVGGGNALVYEWTSQNELGAIKLVRNDGLHKTLVDNLEWQPFAGGQRGLVGARLGNKLRVDWHFDKTLRTLKIEHRTEAAGQRAPPTVRYTYDEHGKVSSKSVGDEKNSYQHDDLGRLIASSSGAITTRYEHPSAVPSKRRKRQPPPRLLKTAGRPVAPQAGNRTDWYQSPTGARVALDSSGRPQWALTQGRAAWRYLYNAAGERIGRLNLTDPAQSRWYIYDKRRLLMETDATGNPTKLYVYLDERPFAVVDLAAPEPAIQWIHTDAIGLPVAVTDESAQLLWQGVMDPWGSLPTGAPPPPTQIRLPGQIHDPETGLHDNYQRTYDPIKRRYLGPDPLGIRTSGQRYAYANHSPLDTTDPLGLYEVDMHYYATLVIALSAGMEYREAMLIANANQYVDNGIDTQPIILNPDGSRNLPATGLLRQQVLRDWHFVLDEGNPANDQIANPSSRRLTELENWVNNAPDRDTMLFNLGVYSHPYLDTAAHRDANNVPYPPTRVGLAIGHGHDLHHPDYTFNHCQEFVSVEGDQSYPDPPTPHTRSWNNNESRTIAIQESLYRVYRRYASNEAAVSWDELQVMLRQFNSIHEKDEPHNDNHEEILGQKLRLLERFMRQYRIRTGGDDSQRISFVARDREANSAYNEAAASAIWNTYFSEPSRDN